MHFEEHGMIVVKSPVIQLATAEHVVQLKELRNERAAARTDVIYISYKLFFIVQPTW